MTLRPEVVILSLALVIGLAAVALGALAYNELASRGAMFENHVLASDGQGGVASAGSVESFVKRAAGGSRSVTSVTTTGAAALNVSIEVLRYDRLRSYTVTTSTPGAIASANVLVVPLAGTGVLDRTRDAPLLPADPEAGLPVACDYVSHDTDKQYGCLMLVFFHNASLVVTPLELGEIDTPPIKQPMAAATFPAAQVGAPITLAARFQWIVPEN